MNQFYKFSLRALAKRKPNNNYCSLCTCAERSGCTFMKEQAVKPTGKRKKMHPTLWPERERGDHARRNTYHDGLPFQQHPHGQSARGQRISHRRPSRARAAVACRRPVFRARQGLPRRVKAFPARVKAFFDLNVLLQLKSWGRSVKGSGGGLLASLTAQGAVQWQTRLLRLFAAHTSEPMSTYQVHTWYDQPIKTNFAERKFEKAKIIYNQTVRSCPIKSSERGEKKLCRWEPRHVNFVATAIKHQRSSGHAGQ